MNLPGFTAVYLALEYGKADIKFSGPGGKVWMTTRVDGNCLALKLLSYFDTSNTERLEIRRGRSQTSDLLHRALLPMQDLRTLVLTQCKDPHVLIHALHPSMSSSGAVICPELEELIIELDFSEVIDIGKVAEIMAAKASRGVKLGTIRIVRGYRGVHIQPDVSELEKHVSHVESPWPSGQQ